LNPAKTNPSNVTLEGNPWGFTDSHGNKVGKRATITISEFSTEGFGTYYSLGW